MKRIIKIFHNILLGCKQLVRLVIIFSGCREVHMRNLYNMSCFMYLLHRANMSIYVFLCVCL